MKKTLTKKLDKPAIEHMKLIKKIIRGQAMVEGKETHYKSKSMIVKQVCFTEEEWKTIKRIKDKRHMTSNSAVIKLLVFQSLDKFQQMELID